MNMVTIKTADLIGPALDYAVGIAAGMNVWLADGVTVDGLPMVCEDFASDMHWCPSTDWSQGGPLLAEYAVGFVGYDADSWEAFFSPEDTVHQGVGPTHLIAACRAIVAAKLGAEVQVPAELVKP